MRLLFATSGVDAESGNARKRFNDLKSLLDPNGGTEVIALHDLSMSEYRDRAGSFEAIPEVLCDDFDAVVLLETTAGGLSRGCCELTLRFQDAGKGVSVLRGDQVLDCGVEGWIEEDAKLRFGRCVDVQDEEVGE